MSAFTPFVLDHETGVCIVAVTANPNTMGLVLPKSSLALDGSTGKAWVSQDSDTSDWSEIAFVP